ncbi:hypothetical protein GBAR_LOCUS11984 [Geodia barretti]|uniref:Fibronectin type-III domain-containing protein n=1 Tax=Geodia barretti TaxID=519541 RepID=A0AA35RZC0_GEOBA|nr:hypothetical protein GBAR_LOCUS11984 [Geodia barretti]
MLFVFVFFNACTSNEDFANPLDPENLRTSGAPDGLTLHAGDKQVRVTWSDTGQEGIKAYHIYRRSTGGADTEFQQVGSVDAPANEYIDTQRLENDRRDASGRLLAYEYRITYLDANGVETPDPANPPAESEDPRRIWKTAVATPSVPPPAPNVTLGDPTDLTIKLFWEGYEFPYDFSIFRVYAALDTEDDKPLRFKLIAEPKRDQLYYFDHNFQVDGTRKVYRVAGVDEFGAEAITTITAAVPNVPPAPPKNVRRPVGKGGSSTTFGLFQYSKVDLLPDLSQKVDIGGFEETHRVTFQIETFLVPVRFSYGLSDELDLVLGGTFSTGGVRKIVHDFYNTATETSDDPNINRRVYDQPLFDGVIGLKYNIKPDRNDNFPSISVGGDAQFGFTADDRLNSDKEFLDHSPADGFPFFGINTYLVGTQRFGNLFKLHAGVGVFLTSKALKTTDFFTLNWQIGSEIAVSDNMWLIADFSRELPYAGIHVTNLIGIAFRYEISNTLAFQLGFNNQPGFQFNLTFGGEDTQGLEGENLLF